MEHTIVIYRKLKERDDNGSYQVKIVSRYTLTDDEITESEKDKYTQDIEEPTPYEYFAEIEETKH